MKYTAMEWYRRANMACLAGGADIVQHRYEIYAVSDDNLTSVNDELLAATDNEQEAKTLAIKHSAGWPYGAAIVDTETGEIDFGLWEDDYENND